MAATITLDVVDFTEKIILAKISLVNHRELREHHIGVKKNEGFLWSNH